MKIDFNKFLIKASLALFLLSIAFFLSGQSYGQKWSAAEKEVWELDEMRFRMFAKGDLGAFVKDFREDGSFWLSANKEPMNKKGAENTFFARPIGSAELKPLSVKIFGNVAISQYSLKVGGMVSGSGKYRETIVRLKQDGKWQIIASMSAQE